jgi:hypothetical protein
MSRTAGEIMAEYRTVRMSFWHDPFIEELDAKAKLLYLYLFTCPYANNLGIVEATRRKIAYETSMTSAEVDRYLEVLQTAGKVVCDPEHNLIFLVNFIRHQTTTSPKMIDGLAKLTVSIPSPVIAKALCIRYPMVYGFEGYPIDTVSIPYANGMDTVTIPSAEFGSWKREVGKGKMEEGRGKRTRPPDTPPEKIPPAENPDTPKPSKPPETVKLPHGENGNVKLTAEDFEKLRTRYGPETTDKAIAFLDLHIGAKGKDEYKSHYHALQKWVFDAVKEREGRQARASPQVKSFAELEEERNMREARRLAGIV